MNVLLVDDEPLAREGLAMQLEKHADVTVIGESRNGSEAIRAILTLSPDLVFLDVKMPRITGFDVVETVGVENMPLVVFLTGFDQHAIRAFDVHALDYLLKPLDPERLDACLDRAREELLKSSVNQQATKLHQLLGETDGGNKPRDRIVVRSAGHVHFLRPAEIRWVEAAGDYVTLHTDGREHLLRETMLSMEKRLLPLGFRRIHRSTIVNLDWIAELIANESGDYLVVLTDATQLKLSRSYRDELYASMDV